MAVDVIDVLPGLLEDLRIGRPRLDRLRDYYQGRSADPYVPQQASPELRRLVEIAATAWGGLIVDATAERLVVDGVKSTLPGMEEAAWSWWQASSLDARQTAVHSDALVCGHTFVLVWPDPDGGPPTIRGLDARDTLGWRAGTDPSRLASAMHTWEAQGVQWAAVYDAEVARMFARPQKPGLLVAAFRWWRGDTVDVGPSDDWVSVDVLPHGMGGCPVVRMANTPDLRGDGVSDIEPHIPAIDRVTETVLGRLTAGKFGAYRQRWATGLQLGHQVDPRTGEPVLGADGQPLPAGAPFRYGADLLWTSEDPDAKFGDFAATDLRPIVDAVEQDIKHLAAVTRTPAHYLLGGSANPPSAEALLAAESGLASKVRRRQLDFGEAWEQVLRLAATAAGEEELAADAGLEVVWKHTEVASPGAVADAMLKLRQVGIPLRVLLESLGYSPQSIERTLTLAEEERAAATAAQAAAFGG